MNPLLSTEKKHFYIGLMSGTSIDSIDAALMDFSETLPDKKPALLCTTKKSFEPSLRQQLLLLCQQTQQAPTLAALGEMDRTLGEAFATAALELLKKSGTPAEKISAIGSHGQTIFHQPPQNGHNGFSWQIGDPNIIAQRTGITTVADFRRKDMAAGGQGAPLVPAFHNAVFRSSTRRRIIVNIGGIANITVLPIADKTGDKVRGWDTGPGNVLLDSWITRHQHKDYDENGSWAADGKIDQTLLNKLLCESFFDRAPPKSTGRELFNINWLDQKLSAAPPLSAINVQTTLTALTAKSIANAIAQYTSQTDEVFVCGGGAYNGFLMKLLKEYTQLPVSNTSALGIEPDWVEAAAFAWLAKQTMENKPGNLPEVTGAKQALVLGGIYC